MNFKAKTKRNYLVILTTVAVFLGIFFRLYNLKKNAGFEWDQVDTVEKVYGMIKNRKPLLIGPRVGPAKFFLPPLYYYLVIPFILVTKLDPFGLYLASAFIGTITGTVCYFLTKEIFNKKTACLSAMIYFLSPLFISFDRVPWNVNLIAPSALLTFLGIFRIFVKKSSRILDYFILGLGMGVGIQAHLTAVFLPIVVLCMVFITKKLDRKLSLSFLVGFLFILPLIVFDLRHKFLNFNAVIEFLSLNNSQIEGPNFLTRVINNYQFSLEMVGKLIFYQGDASFRLKVFTGLILVVFMIKRAFFLKEKDKDIYQSMIIFIFIPSFFLSFYKGAVPEYYFLLITPILIISMADLLIKELSIFKSNVVGARILLTLFLTFTILVNFSYLKKTDLLSFFYKKSVVEYILRKAGDRPFKITYMMGFGHWARSAGFDYLFKLENRVSKAEAELEFFITYPVNDEKKEEGFVEVGAFGVKGP